MRATGLGAAPEEIVFGANMTTLTFHLSRALGRSWGPEDSVVVTELDHHANIAPWQALERERGVAIATTVSLSAPTSSCMSSGVCVSTLTRPFGASGVVLIMQFGVDLILGGSERLRHLPLLGNDGRNGLAADVQPPGDLSHRHAFLVKQEDRFTGSIMELF